MYSEIGSIYLFDSGKGTVKYYRNKERTQRGENKQGWLQRGLVDRYFIGRLFVLSVRPSELVLTVFQDYLRAPQIYNPDLLTTVNNESFGLSARNSNGFIYSNLAIG